MPNQTYRQTELHVFHSCLSRTQLGWSQVQERTHLWENKSAINKLVSAKWDDETMASKWQGNDQESRKQRMTHCDCNSASSLFENRSLSREPLLNFVLAVFEKNNMCTNELGRATVCIFGSDSMVLYLGRRLCEDTKQAVQFVTIVLLQTGCTCCDSVAAGRSG